MQNEANIKFVRSESNFKIVKDGVISKDGKVTCKSKKHQLEQELSPPRPEAKEMPAAQQKMRTAREKELDNIKKLMEDEKDHPEEGKKSGRVLPDRDKENKEQKNPEDEAEYGLLKKLRHRPDIGNAKIVMEDERPRLNIAKDIVKSVIKEEVAVVEFAFNAIK